MLLRALLLSIAFLLPASSAFAQSGAMTFRVVRPANCAKNCAEYILGDGYILSNSYARYLNLARRLKRPLPVYLRSPGGLVDGGIRLGQALRARKARVLVARGGECSSACAYAFLGGASRSVPSGARLGVHRSISISVIDGKVVIGTERDAREIAMLRRYMASMGANPGLAEFAASVDPRRMHYLNDGELRRFGVVSRI